MNRCCPVQSALPVSRVSSADRLSPRFLWVGCTDVGVAGDICTVVDLPDRFRSTGRVSGRSRNVRARPSTRPAGYTEGGNPERLGQRVKARTITPSPTATTIEGHKEACKPLDTRGSMRSILCGILARSYATRS